MMQHHTKLDQMQLEFFNFPIRRVIKSKNAKYLYYM